MRLSVKLMKCFTVEVFQLVNEEGMIKHHYSVTPNKIMHLGTVIQWLITEKEK